MSVNICNICNILYIHSWGIPLQQFGPGHWLTASSRWSLCRSPPWNGWQSPPACVYTSVLCGSWWWGSWCHSPKKSKRGNEKTCQCHSSHSQHYLAFKKLLIAWYKAILCRICISPKSYITTPKNPAWHTFGLINCTSLLPLFNLHKKISPQQVSSEEWRSSQLASSWTS